MMRRLLYLSVTLVMTFGCGFLLGTLRERVRCELLEQERRRLHLVASRMSEVSAHCTADLAATIGVWTRPLSVIHSTRGRPGGEGRPADPPVGNGPLPQFTPLPRSR